MPHSRLYQLWFLPLVDSDPGDPALPRVSRLRRGLRQPTAEWETCCLPGWAPLLSWNSTWACPAAFHKLCTWGKQVLGSAQLQTLTLQPPLQCVKWAIHRNADGVRKRRGQRRPQPLLVPEGSHQSPRSLPSQSFLEISAVPEQKLLNSQRL